MVSVNRSAARARRHLAVAAVLAAGLLVVACGSDDESSGDSASKGGGEKPTLSVTTFGEFVTAADMYVAETKGFFDKVGVDVEIKNLGTGAVTSVAGGQDDLVTVTSIASFPVADQGRETSIIYQTQEGLGADILVSADSQIKDIMDLSGKKLGTLPPGTGFYGAASLYADYVESKGGTRPKLVLVKGADASVLASGIVDAVMSVPDNSLPYIKSGKARYLVNGATSPIAKSIAPENIVGPTNWGISSNLEKKRDAVVRYVAAMRMADEWMAKASDEEIAQELHALPGFSQSSIEDLVERVKVTRPYFTSTAGNISKETWDAALQSWVSWEIPGFDAESDKYSYDSRVDMSYWNDASKLVAK